MSEQENVALVKRWFHEVWNEGRTETVMELLAPKVMGIGQVEDGSMITNPEEFLVFMKRLRGAFPNIRITVEDAFGSGDKVATRWTVRGTHTGDHLGVAASGKDVAIRGISIATIRGGKIVEGWDNWDQLKMMQEIGAVEVPTARLAAKM
jgi:steroid delta-isomerase-like uncharacterized protein